MDSLPVRQRLSRKQVSLPKSRSGDGLGKEITCLCHAVSFWKAAFLSPVTLQEKDMDIELLLEKSSQHHSHLCPRQILGVRIGLAGMAALGLEHSDALQGAAAEALADARWQRPDVDDRGPWRLHP